MIGEEALSPIDFPDENPVVADISADSEQEGAQIQSQLQDVFSGMDEEKKARLANEFMALNPVSEEFEIAWRYLKVPLGDIPCVEVGEIAEEKAEQVIYEEIPKKFESDKFVFEKDLYKLLDQFWAGGIADENTNGEFIFNDKVNLYRGMIQVCWKGNNLTLHSAKIEAADSTLPFFQKLNSDPELVMGVLQQAVEQLTDYLRTNHFKMGDFNSEAISPEGWNYVWKKPKEKIKERNEKRMEEQRIEEEKNERLRTIADKLFAFFDEAVSRLRPGLTTELDDNVFGNWKDKTAVFRENAVKNLMGTIEFLPAEVDFESQEFIDFIENYIANAQIGHNRTEKYGLENHPEERVQMLARGNARDLITYLDMDPNQAYLSSAMVNASSESTKKFGTGWTGDTCYIFSLEEYARKSLVFSGDVDQPAHEGPVEERSMMVKDALLISALHNYTNTVINKLQKNTSYNELLLFGKIDFKDPSLEKINLNR